MYYAYLDFQDDEPEYNRNKLIDLKADTVESALEEAGKVWLDNHEGIEPQEVIVLAEVDFVDTMALYSAYRAKKDTEDKLEEDKKEKELYETLKKKYE